MSLTSLLDNNEQWAANRRAQDPSFFQRLATQQTPEYLWIGCADSRVPATEICGLEPGEMFVHRNIANVVSHADINCLSVLQYAVEVLKVKHIIVCGHYGCGGVKAAMQNDSLGLIDHWLVNIKDVFNQAAKELLSLDDLNARTDRLCELNVQSQVQHLCRTVSVQKAWARGQQLAVHGFIYGLHDGRLKDLSVSLSGQNEIPPVYRIHD